jgi:predicted small integral membrane protein
MLSVRASKTIMVAAIAVFASLVSFGNLTDYGTNLPFVEHVLEMDTIFPTATIKYRAIDDPVLQSALYDLIITTEVLIAIVCWIGAVQMVRHLNANAQAFNRSKSVAVIGLTLGFLLWQVGFMTIGGEWFGMWMSKEWNGTSSAFHFAMTIMAVLIYVSLPDAEHS